MAGGRREAPGGSGRPFAPLGPAAPHEGGQRGRARREQKRCVRVPFPPRGDRA